jgi:hypothetical protein
LVIVFIISLLITIFVWSHAGPVWGLLSGFLLIGGLGWKLAGRLVGLAVLPFRPGWIGFVNAWEQRIGDERRSGRDVPDAEVLSMRSAYRSWRVARKESGESAGDWLDRELGLGKWKPELVRHVPFYKDGKGATFELRREDGKPKWSWRYDSGTPDDFMTMMATDKAITTIEKELGLPLTFPHLDPDKPREKPVPETEEQKAEKLRDLERRADSGDAHAKSRLWELRGTPISDPSQLREGFIYYAGFDLGVYQGTFVGRRYEGYPDIDNEPEVREWFQFEMAESSQAAPNRYRIPAEDFLPETLESGEVRYTVIAPPVEQPMARTVFDQLRAEYQEWDRKRGPERHF